MKYSKHNISCIYAKYGNILKLMWLKSINYKIDCNIFAIAAQYGQNETLMLLKQEFPEIKGTSEAFNCAAEHGHNETLKLLKREFPEIKGTLDAFDLASCYGHNDTLKLLKLEFPEIKGTSNAFDWAAEEGYILRQQYQACVKL